MRHKTFIIPFILLCTVLLSGCWDRVELKDVDIVIAIGIDEGIDDVENRFRVTVQVINEGQIASASGQGGKGGSPVTTYSATGSTVEEALRKVSPKTPRNLFFPHLQLLVVGEELAKQKGIQNLFDWVERDSQFRGLFHVLVSKNNTAKNVLQILTPLEPIPSIKIVDSLESTQKIWGELTSTRADKVIQQLDGKVALLTGIEITGDPEQGNSLTNVQQISPQAELETKGLVIFKNGKPEKWLYGSEARGVVLINNEISKTIINLNCKKEKKGISVDVSRAKTNIKAEIKKGKPIIHLTVRSEGHISEVHCPVDLEKHETIEKLEKQMEKEIKEEILMALEAAKEQKSDIFRFGEYVNREDPKLWKKIKGKWNDEIFPKTEVNVNVQSFIRRSGLRTRSYIK